MADRRRCGHVTPSRRRRHASSRQPTLGTANHRQARIVEQAAVAANQARGRRTIGNRTRDIILVNVIFSLEQIRTYMWLADNR